MQGIGTKRKIDYVRDVMPVLSKLGCNQGICHGSKDGKNGFKLSLRGYDPLYDVRAFTDELASRRVNIASPADSLMLLKATGAVPHEGGQITPTGSKYYQILHEWIATGAKLDLDASRVTAIEVSPKIPLFKTSAENNRYASWPPTPMVRNAMSLPRPLLRAATRMSPKRMTPA